ncbi:MAG: hypothetical protein AB7H71_18020 [Alphaproteobacteria bacterium]
MTFSSPRAPFPASRRAFVFTVVLPLAAGLTIAAHRAQSQASLAGIYDGNQMEMAVGLELMADGRFRYALAYGALDEQATGRWTTRGNQVLLTSDPVTPPRFVLVSQQRGANGLLQVQLDVPRGVSRQYFNAFITKSNGETERRQLAEDGLQLPFASNDAPIGIRLVLQVFDVASQPVRLDPAAGYSLRFRFEPNDIGKVAFQATPLAIVNGDLMLDRHGRTIRFRRASR